MLTHNSLFSHHIPLHTGAALPGRERLSRHCNSGQQRQQHHNYRAPCISSHEKVLTPNGSTMPPSQAPNPRERGRPAGLTNLAPRLREVLDIVLLILLVRRRARGHLSRHAQTAHGTRYLCLQGTAVPQSPAPPSGSPAAMWPVLLCDITAQGSRKGRILFLQKQSPSETVCRLFILAPLTAITPRTGAKSAKTM